MVDVTPGKSSVPLWIDGQEVHVSTVFEVISPVTSERIWDSSSASNDDAVLAVDAAARALPSWSATTPAARRSIFLKAAEMVESRIPELQKYFTQETGAEAAFSKFNMTTSMEMLRDIAGRIPSAMTGTVPTSENENTQAIVLKEPYGVVLGIAPWNAPFILGFRSVIYALAGGNTCVLKGSETSPKCFWAIGDVFKQAGLPDGCLNVIYHRPEDAAEVTETLISHPAVKKINFTGSTAVGRIIAASAGKHLKPTLMELGGKASSIVCEDADLNKAASQCALGAFLHSGQICMATERILVHQSVIEPFTEALKTAIAKIFSAESDAPILAQPNGVAKSRDLISDAASKGATVVYGSLENKDVPKNTMRPMVLGKVTKEMDIYSTESFGPSVSLITVESDDEAIKIANDTEYGLTGAVFTENLARGLRIAKRIESGAVHINSMSVHDEAGLPHGGTKSSGWGRFNAQWGIEEFLRTKTITFQL